MRGTTSQRPYVEGSIARGSNRGHTTPLWLLVTALLYGIAFFLGSVVQITGTESAVYHLLQSSITIVPNMTAQQLIDIQNGALSQTNLIAAVIGWGVQIFMIMIAFPTNHPMDPRLERLKRGITFLIIGSDIVTDAIYALDGHSVLAGWGFAPGGFGAVIVALLYPMVVCGVTIFCGIQLAHSIDELINHLRG